MRNNIASMALFLIIFVVTYLIICFAIPGMRIKLDAEPIRICRSAFYIKEFDKFQVAELTATAGCLLF